MGDGMERCFEITDEDIEQIEVEIKALHLCKCKICDKIPQVVSAGHIFLNDKEKRAGHGEIKCRNCGITIIRGTGKKAGEVWNILNQEA